MKKKFLVFILCFCLIFTTSIYHDKNIQVVKANPALALSFITLALTSMGVTYYYQSTQNNLQNDIEIFCNETNQDYSTWIGTFGNIVVDVGKKVVKYSAAQIYAIKQFVNYLIGKNEVSDVPINATSFDYVPLYGYPTLFKPKYMEPVTVSDSYGNSVTLTLYTDAVCYLGFVGQSNRVNSDNNNILTLLCISPNSSSVAIKCEQTNNPKVDANLSYPNHFTSGYGNTFLRGNKFGENFLSFYVNGTLFVNSYYTTTYDGNIYSFGKFRDMCRLRFGYDSVSGSYNGLVLPSYAVNKSVFNTADDTKPLVVSAPEVIDKAVDIAINANPDATSVTLNDVAVAIDDTAVGVIDPSAVDDDEKVIAPDLTLPLDTTQDLEISDTITEDLVITDPLPPPDPPPDIPDIDIELGSKFPFSVFYDFVAIMDLFDATPVAPSFPLGFEFLGNEYEFIIDLSEFDSVARILRLMELIAFISGLVFLTIRYIRGKD